ncbi:MAG TPA: HDOD domain-containing protein, partial [Campylobacterales bacterium]|nr:HDOD domain-containing protein [Campylobacterales bacterium]
MVNRQELEEFIKKLPPKPDIVIRTLEEIENRDLKKASQIASTDPVLVKYLRNLINKPIFGLRNRVTDIGQIFTLLGSDAVSELLHHYLLSLITPKEWRIFNLDTNSFE